MIIITGASDNHYLSLINMINSFVKYNEKNYLIVYNLGLTDENWNNLKNKFNNYTFIIYKIFDYSKYPEWFNINIEAGQYAWKPTIIYNTFLEYDNEIILWMDAGNLIKNNLLELEKFITNNFIYSAISSGDIKKWTHPTTITYLKCSCLNMINRNAACLGFNTTVNSVKNFLLEFYNCSQIKECIAPDGSNRNNHRQDQAVFTILFYKYLSQNNIVYNHQNGSQYIGYTIHNDVD
jgi:hypothetical protein